MAGATYERLGRLCRFIDLADVVQALSKCNLTEGGDWQARKDTDALVEHPSIVSANARY
jgi:hypothetical protein